MSKIYKVAIVGGGASGLLSAVELLSGENAFNGSDIVIIERCDRIGKKLICTGNGQGNLSNAQINASNYYGDKYFIEQVVQDIKDIDIVRYLGKIGIKTINDDGKIYPVSKQASSVLDIIRAFLQSRNCEIITSSKVQRIQKSNKNFSLELSDKKINAENVILAVGGKSQKQFGTDGTSYNLATDFGHKLTDLFPSLVQLKTDTTKIKGLKGLKETAKVDAFDNGKLKKSAVGDLLFTDYGVSGNSIFSVSAGVADSTNATLSIEFLPNYSETELADILSERLKLKYFNYENVLYGLMNKKIAQTILKNVKSNSVNDIVKAAKHFTLKVNGTTGFNYSQTTRGGIKTSDVDKNFESKLCKGLYLVGEMLDIDGDCGGYNLTFAFISGIISAKNIKKI